MDCNLIHQSIIDVKIWIYHSEISIFSIPKGQPNFKIMEDNKIETCTILKIVKFESLHKEEKYTFFSWNSTFISNFYGSLQGDSTL